MFYRGNIKYTVLFISMFAASLFSQVYDWRPLGTGTSNGTTGNVYAVTQFGGKIIAGGGFTSAGGVSVANIAAWDPGTNLWTALGSGLNDTVYSLYVYNSELYAAGSFTFSGSTQVNGIAKWNGSSWQALGSGLNGEGRAMLQFGTDLIVGGDFTNAGGVSANNIARWNGTVWSSLGSGVTGSGDVVFALTIFNSELIVGGRFGNAGGTGNINNIAKWNGTTWDSLGRGTNERVFALAVYNGELIVGGRFTYAGTLYAINIAEWDGNSWANLGYYNAFYENQYIDALIVYNGNLIVGGGFHFCDTTYVDRVTAWNGTLWGRMSTGMNNRVKSFYIYNNELYGCGEFSTASGRYCNHIAKWGTQTLVSVSGEVRYSDNNQPVLAGKVKVLRLDVNTREVIVVDQGVISNGTYLLPNVMSDSGDRVIAFPDDELDFVPTYHPNYVDWANSVPIHTYNNQTNININVQRITLGPQNPVVITIGGFVYLNIIPPQNPPANGYPYWKDAVVYFMQGSDYRKFAVSGPDQSYLSTTLAPGTYDMFVSRFGYTTAIRTVNLGSTSLDTINFYLDSLNLMGLHNVNSNVPEGYLLMQNYPNPFNPLTTIGFLLPADGFVELKIYDVLGREVSILVNQQLKAGEYKYMFNAENLPSGIYFYSLKTKDFIQTKKMVLVK